MVYPYTNTGYSYMNPYIQYNPYSQSFIGATPYLNYQVQQTQAPQVQPSQPQPQTGVIRWINSEKEVADEYVSPNNAVALWNANEPVIYLKQADATGKPTVKTYDLVERVEVEKTEVSYASADDLSMLAGAVKQLNESVTSVVGALSSMKDEIDAMKNDMYGIAGKKKTVRKTEAEDDG